MAGVEDTHGGRVRPTVAAVAEENAAAAQEMAALAEQLEGALATIASLAGAGHTAGDASDESLNGLAARLHRLVASFRLEDEAPREPTPLRPAVPDLIAASCSADAKRGNRFHAGMK